MICPRGLARPARRTEGKAWRGEAYQRDPCFFFRHANVPSFCSQGGRASQRQGSLGGEGRGWVGVCITVLSRNKDFLSCSLCLQIKMISSVEVWETNRGMVLVHGCCTVQYMYTNTVHRPDQA